MRLMDLSKQEGSSDQICVYRLFIDVFVLGKSEGLESLTFHHVTLQSSCPMASSENGVPVGTPNELLRFRKEEKIVS